MGYMVIQAAKMAVAGSSAEEIIAKMTELKATIGNILSWMTSKLGPQWSFRKWIGVCGIIVES